MDRVPLAPFETAQSVWHGRQLGRGMRPRRAERWGSSNSPSGAHDGLDERLPLLRIAFHGQDILAHAAVVVVTAVHLLATRPRGLALRALPPRETRIFL